MARRVLEYFHPNVEVTDSDLPRLLDLLPARVRGSIKTAFVKASTLTLGILKSQFPNAVLDGVADGWAATVDRDKAEQLMASFREVGRRLARMLSSEPEYDNEL